MKPVQFEHCPGMLVSFDVGMPFSLSDTNYDLNLLESSHLKNPGDLDVWNGDLDGLQRYGVNVYM